MAAFQNFKDNAAGEQVPKVAAPAPVPATAPPVVAPSTAQPMTAVEQKLGS